MLENWILRPPSSGPPFSRTPPQYGRTHSLVLFLFLCVLEECVVVATDVERVEQERIW